MPAVDANGDVYVVWMGQEPGPFTLERNYYFAKSTDGGQNFEAENIIVEDLEIFTGLGINNLNRIYPFPIIATNPVISGHVYITWNNKVFGPDPQNLPDSSDVLFIRSTDYGETWSSPINIINNGLDPSPTLNDQFFPWIAVNPEGDRLSIMYYDRSDFPDNDSMHVKIITSIDDGLSFTSPLRITNVPSYPGLLTHQFLFMGDYNGMAYSPTGILYPIWADSRHGNWDIFTAPAHLKVVSNSIDSGWVTLSVPVVVEDFTKTVVWPTADPNSSTYSYCGSGGYVPESMLENGVGYYVKFNSDKDLIYAGDFVEQYGTEVCADWNIVGSISEDVPISTNVCLFPGANSFTSSFFIYQNGYQLTNTIKSGMGHWIKVAMDGGLLVYIDPIECDTESQESIEEETMDHFIVTDANGKQQDLYVANLDLNPSLGGTDLTMPPPLPEVGFDARFEAGEFIKPVSPDSGVVELVIDIETQAYPVNVSWELNPENGIEYSIVTEGMGKESNSARISHSGSTTLTSSSNGKFLLNAQANKSIGEDNLPTVYSLEQNYPNPFNPVTQIRYSVAKDELEKIKVYGVLGNEVATLVNSQQQSGSYEISWDASNFASGIYFYQLKAGNFIAIKKMILIK